MALLLRASISTLLEYPLCKENTRAKTNGELPRPLPETSADIGVQWDAEPAVSANVYVQKAEVVSLSISTGRELIIGVGHENSVTVYAEYKGDSSKTHDVTDDAKLSVVGPNFAIVEGNQVLGLSVGTSELKALFRDKEASVNIEVKKPEIGTLRKTGYWYGPSSYLKVSAGSEPKAEAICDKCSHQSFTYTWLVDMDDDGNFSGSSDRSYVQESYAPSFDEYGKTVRLMAEHDEAEAVIREYIPKVYKDIVSNKGASVAQMSDGSVIAWGDSAYGGVLDTVTSSALSSSSTSVVKLVATHRAFAALMSDGSVVAWGDGSYGGRLDASKLALIQVGGGAIDIAATQGAFAVVLSNGDVEAWGDVNYGGDGPRKEDINGPGSGGTTYYGVSIMATDFAFQVQLSYDNWSVRWGDVGFYGTGTIIQPSSSLTAISMTGYGVNANRYLFSKIEGALGYVEGCYIQADLSGSCDVAGSGGLDNSSHIFTTTHSIIRFNAGVMNIHGWNKAMPSSTPTESILPSEIQKAQSISFASAGGVSGAFSILKKDGSVVDWGDHTSSGSIKDAIKDPGSIIDMFPNDNVFMALQPDGNLIVWGNIVSPNDVIPATAAESEKVIP